MNLLKAAWNGWKKFSEVFGHFMSGVILTILYLTLFLPYGIALSLFSDPLHLKAAPKESNWETLPEKDSKIETYRKQF